MCIRDRRFTLGLDSVLGSAIPREIIPEDLTATLKKENWQLILVQSEYKVASDEVNKQCDELNAIIKKYDSNAMLIGEAPCTKDLIRITDKDFKVVNAKMCIRDSFKILLPIPTIFAVPTTAGTGSETTVAAVITEAATHHKASMNDLCLMPKYAVLDPALTVGLPPQVTATTGMDALCHAVESYTNNTYNSKLEKDTVSYTHLKNEETKKFVEGELLI